LAAADVFRLSAQQLDAEGLGIYPDLARLAQVAPLSMSQQAFTGRCKTLFEIWNRIPSGAVRRILEVAGHSRASIKELGSLKLLQALLNLTERLNAEHETVGSFAGAAKADDLTHRNPRLAGLFIANDLRLADAHELQEKIAIALEALGVDPGEVVGGYGKALDVLFDAVIDSVDTAFRALLTLSER
jgi:hypothetical protein